MTSNPISIVSVTKEHVNKNVRQEVLFHENQSILLEMLVYQVSRNAKDQHAIPYEVLNEDSQIAVINPAIGVEVGSLVESALAAFRPWCLDLSMS